jgi:hypothetical protein
VNRRKRDMQRVFHSSLRHQPLLDQLSGQRLRGVRQCKNGKPGDRLRPLRRRVGVAGPALGDDQH